MEDRQDNMKTDRAFVLQYAKGNYGTEPEYLWERTPDAGVLRHTSNKKWYGIVMSVSLDKLGLDSGAKADILNVKCDPIVLGSFLMKKGYYPAYHMNKRHWLTILLDGSVPSDEIEMLIDGSYELTK